MPSIGELVDEARHATGTGGRRVAAFEKIVRQFQDMAYGYAIAVLGDTHLAQDAAQEAFLFVWRHLDELDHPAAFPTWFRRIVRTQCNRLTRGKRVPTGTLDEAADVRSREPTPHIYAERNELREGVFEAIRALPDHEREATTLFYMDGYTQNEIADFLGVRATTISSRLHSARKRLQGRLAAMVQDELRAGRPSQDDSFVDRHVERVEQVEDQAVDLRLRWREGDPDARKTLMEGMHDKKRFFDDLRPDNPEISHRDARTLLANRQDFATWRKYEGYLHLDPDTQAVINAVWVNDVRQVREILTENPAAADPSYVTGYERTEDEIDNDSVPILAVAEAVFDGAVPPGENERAMAHAIMEAGANPELQHGLPVRHATSWNAFETVVALLDNGASVDGPYGHGCPMAFALHFGHPHFVRLFAERGAKLDLRFAAGAGDLELVRSFVNPDGSLKEGAGAQADPYTGSTSAGDTNIYRMERTRENILLQAFYFACQGAQYECAEYLLGLGVDINAVVPGLDVNSPTLNWCVWLNWFGEGGDRAKREERYAETVRFLLSHGARPNAAALRRDSPDAIRDAVLDHMVQSDLGIPLDFWLGFNLEVMVEWVTLCIKHGWNINLAQPWDGGTQTALHFLAFAGDTRKVACLLRHGADPHVTDGVGRTPLHVVGQKGIGKGIAELLLDHGADLNTRDRDGRTPLDYARQAKKQTIARFLTERGAEHSART